MPSLCANASVGPVDGHCTEWLTVQAGEDGEGPAPEMSRGGYGGGKNLSFY